MLHPLKGASTKHRLAVRRGQIEDTTPQSLDESIQEFAEQTSAGMDSEPIVPVEQKEIPFRGKMLMTALLKDGQGYVVVSSLAESFGIHRQTLQGRLNRKKEQVCSILIQTGGGQQAQVCINATAARYGIYHANSQRPYLFR